MPQFSDEQALAFVQGEAYRISAEVIEQPYQQWDFEGLIYVDTSGPEWAPGVATYTSNETGQAELITPYAKDMPLADVPQDLSLRPISMVGIGYQYNLGEINTALTIAGMRLDDRRARAARNAYQRFMWNTTLTGIEPLGIKGLVNQGGVNVAPAPDVGTGTGIQKRYWGNKTTEQILADFNSGLIGVSSATYGSVLANTVLLPDTEAQRLGSTVMPDTGGRTVLSWLQESNAYTLQTGQPLTIRAVRDLRSAATDSTGPSSVGKGRAVFYYDDPSVVRLLLPMPHRFEEVYRDGWANYLVPGIFRTGGVEMLMPQAVRYLDGISNDSDTGV